MLSLYECYFSTELMVILEPKLWSDGNPQPWLFLQTVGGHHAPHTQYTLIQPYNHTPYNQKQHSHACKACTCYTDVKWFRGHFGSNFGTQAIRWVWLLCLNTFSTTRFLNIQFPYEVFITALFSSLPSCPTRACKVIDLEL